MDIPERAGQIDLAHNQGSRSKERFNRQPADGCVAVFEQIIRCWSADVRKFVGPAGPALVNTTMPPRQAKHQS